MKIHRLVTLVLMLAVGLVMVALLLGQAGGYSLLALLLVVLGAAVGGIAMSWRKYGGR